jgi:hypothetical protein
MYIREFARQKEDMVESDGEHDMSLKLQHLVENY